MSGIESIESELVARSGDVMFFADRYDIPVVTPREPERRAGIVALAPAPPDAAPLAASLANHGLTVTVRSDLVRVAPHADLVQEFQVRNRRFSDTVSMSVRGSAGLTVLGEPSDAIRDRHPAEVGLVGHTHLSVVSLTFEVRRSARTSHAFAGRPAKFVSFCEVRMPRPALTPAAAPASSGG